MLKKINYILDRGQKMRLLVLMLVLTVPLAILGMRLAEKVLKNQTVLLE